MNHCAIQQQNAFAAREEMNRSSVSLPLSDRRDPVVCPKPRRLGLLNATINDHMRPLRWHLSHQAEVCDAKAGSDLLDIILTKGGYSADQTPQVASSPPFFSGSPPSRVANPLIQDARFGDEKITPAPFPPPMASPSGPPSSPSSSSRKGGCVRANFGDKPAVRIEGFDCLDRDRRNCSIPALA
ncbi:uncharacterized protein LOC131154569 [Malania oleifera]|uniref:uncharacterized protein LOC131154569 n=1 Tax=Malania oleifera TaxID=397392 RepID=UPI0025AE32A0|nr:uncharacterized protein LOC131154569 [Malania oleifera]XP_057963395.1 uncharacterized protein LOC131154569 [Malania oleifera]